jgi:3-oxoacyl-[acyl-carrier-protein] synthase II
VTDPEIAIVGMGVVGGFGVGRQGLLEAWQRGGGPNATVPVQTPSGLRELPAYQADVAPVSRFVSPAALRRMNRFAKLAVLGAALALEDAAWSLPLKRNDIGLIVASGYGASKSTFDFLDSMIDDDGRCPSPTLFSNSVHSSAASHLGIVLEVGGPCLTVSQFEMSVVSALLTARQWLREGQVQAVLFGAVDELCPVLGYCYDRLFGAGAQGPIEPLAWHKQTAVMGEGAAFLLLQRGEDSVRAYGSIDRLVWMRSRDVKLPRDGHLVLGAAGHVCCARDYRRLAEQVDSCVAYTPVYGSLPGGSAFDIALAALAAEQGMGPRRVCLAKCDAQGNCGIVECQFDRSPSQPA